MKKNRRYIPLSQPCIGKEEINAAIEALKSGWITLGPKTALFEDQIKDFIGTKYAVALSSATAGLHLALLAAGIGKSDEVIAPVFTFAATINPIIHVGAKPILIDCTKDTFNIDISQIEKNITHKTRAIVPMHYAGQSVDMDKITNIARKYNLVVIEDAAHAIGTTYKKKKIGSISDMTVFSFHPIKNITTGDGGMVLTNNEEFDKKLRLLRLHGMNKEAWRRFDKSGSWFYEITIPGYKYNMTDLSAVIGIEQFKKLSLFINLRRKYVQIYNNLLKNTSEITIPYFDDFQGHAWNLYSILIDCNQLNISRNEIIEKLKDYNIGSSVYWTPIHEHPFYKKTFKLTKQMFPNASWVYERILSLPLSPSMTEKEVEYVGKVLVDLVSQNRKHA